LFAPTAATFAEFEAREAAGHRRKAYEVLFDGKVVAGHYGGPLHAYTVLEGNGAWLHHLDEGWHHFAIRTAGSAPVDLGMGELIDGGMTRLFIFGPEAALKARIVALPPTVTPGMARITLLNLDRTRQIEVVSCADATTCTPISSPLALGGLFEGELPISALGCPSAVYSEAQCYMSRSSGGAGIGYRLVPSAWLPDPPVTELRREINIDGFPAVFVAAPYYFAEAGEVLRLYH
jgi:hypothetical protein